MCIEKSFASTFNIGIGPYGTKKNVGPERDKKSLIGTKIILSNLERPVNYWCWEPEVFYTLDYVPDTWTMFNGVKSTECPKIIALFITESNCISGTWLIGHLVIFYLLIDTFDFNF